MRVTPIVKALDIAGLRGAGAAEAGTPRAADAREFEQALSGLAGRSVLRAPAAPAAAPSPGALGELSAYLSARDGSNARRMSRILRSGNIQEVDGLVAELSDQSVANQVLAKVVGKAVAGVDQLTKLG